MRVALCLSGLNTGFRESHESIKKFWIDPFETDVFIHTYDTIVVRSGENLCPPSDLSDMQSLYSPTRILIQSWSGIKSVFETDKYESVKKDHRARPKNTLSMYYNIRECNRLKQSYEALMGFRYDLVIRSRFDLCFDAVNEGDYLSAGDNEVYIPWKDGGGNPTGDKSPFIYGGLNDQFAIGRSSCMDQYSETYTHIDEIVKSERFFHPEFLLRMQVVGRCKMNAIGIDIDYHFAKFPEEYK